MGVHAFTSIGDYTVDKKMGEKTFAVAFGKRAAALFTSLVFTLTLLFSGIKTAMFNHYFVLCATLPLIIFIYPSEKMAISFSKLMYVGFIITTMFLILL